ncbi:Lrp/AsnC ligand binding domain-containing protein [Empedobacter sedimenti]|uniref:Lrp/AsnC ligand binding domain-containing protein n=1 Tax=Empedobacter sedimenti TaxID=3042610 RepID=UPI0024A6DA9C|nr:Lrp/AsnC ligand binding domain-containing protein [Empedobacter sedimenti]
MRIHENGQVEIDGIDKMILNAFMDDANLPVSQLAKELGISNTAVHQRIKKLENSGIISATKVILNPSVLGYSTMSFVGVFMDKPSSYKLVITALEKVPEVVEAHFTTGNYGIFLKILCRDNLHLMNVLNKKIQEIEGVTRTETIISLEQPINRQIKL